MKRTICLLFAITMIVCLSTSTLAIPVPEMEGGIIDYLIERPVMLRGNSAPTQSTSLPYTAKTQDGFRDYVYTNYLLKTSTSKGQIRTYMSWDSDYNETLTMSLYKKGSSSPVSSTSFNTGTSGSNAFIWNVNNGSEYYFKWTKTDNNYGLCHFECDITNVNN